MRRHAIRVGLILAGVAAIVLIALFLKDSKYLGERAGYDASAPTESKFARLSRWIPEDSEFYVTVDVPKALAHPELQARLVEIVSAHSGVAVDLLVALVNNEASIGLLTVAGSLGDKDVLPEFMVIAQGEFDKSTLLPAIRSAMSEGKAGLSARDVGWTSIYYESDSRKPFGFAILDGSHMAVGERTTLEAHFAEEPALPKANPDVLTDVLFGHVEIGPRLSAMIPKLMSVPKSVDFSSSDGVLLNGSIKCENSMKAMATAMFVKGIRSLIMLQQENNVPLTNILDGITIDTYGSEVTFSTKLAPLLGLWNQLDHEGNYRSLLNLDKSSVRKLEGGDDGEPEKR